MPKVGMLACNGIGGDDSQPPKSSAVLVATERIDSDTEFIILASTGIWEVNIMILFIVQTKLGRKIGCFNIIS